MIPYFDSIRPQAISGEALDQLLALGWYRMNQTVFTCSHIGQEELYRVHWLRYAVAELENSASQKRIRNRNKKFMFTIEAVKAIDTAHKALHAQYRASIDFDGASSIEECLWGDEEVGESVFVTKCISVYDQHQLIAAGYFDVGKKTAASILHFYDPKYKRCSLGKYLILLTIDYLRDNGFDYYYPGYVVEGLPKMNYKLFLGKLEAFYFDPLSIQWKKFKDDLLKYDKHLI